MASALNRLAGFGVGLAATGAIVNSTLYNGSNDIKVFALKNYKFLPCS